MPFQLSPGWKLSLPVQVDALHPVSNYIRITFVYSQRAYTTSSVICNTFAALALQLEHNCGSHMLLLVLAL